MYVRVGIRSNGTEPDSLRALAVFADVDLAFSRAAGDVVISPCN